MHHLTRRVGRFYVLLSVCSWFQELALERSSETLWIMGKCESSFLQKEVSVVRAAETPGLTLGALMVYHRVENQLHPRLLFTPINKSEHIVALQLSLVPSGDRTNAWLRKQYARLNFDRRGPPNGLTGHHLESVPHYLYFLHFPSHLLDYPGRAE